MIKFFKKLKKIIDFVDSVEFNENDDQYEIRFSKNVLIKSEKNMYVGSSESIIIKTGKENNHLLFLNPTLEKDTDVNQIVRQSEMDRNRSYRPVSDNSELYQNKRTD